MKTETDPDLTELSVTDRIGLGAICQRDSAGRHFTEIWPAEWLERMERAGYIEIDRPVHEQTGLPYEEREWGLLVNQEVVADWFENGVLVGSEELYSEDGDYLGDIEAEVT